MLRVAFVVAVVLHQAATGFIPTVNQAQRRPQQAVKMMPFDDVVLARTLASSAVALEFVALTAAVPLAISAASKRSKIFADAANAEAQAQKAIADRKQLMLDRAAKEQAELAKKIERNKKIEERMQYAREEEERIKRNQEAVLAKERAVQEAKRQAALAEKAAATAKSFA